MRGGLNKYNRFYFWRGHRYNFKDLLGVNGENHVVNVLKAIVTKHRFSVSHIDWFGSYNHGDGSDFKIIDGEFNIVVEGEVKNWQQQNRPYGTDIIKEEVLTRYETQAPVKLLIITFLSLLTQKALELLREHGITVIEVNGLMLGEAKSRLFKPLLRKLYPILKPLLTKHNRRRKFIHNNKQGKLTKYCYPNTVTVTPNKVNNKHFTQHYIYDTTIKNRILDVYLPPYQTPNFTVMSKGDEGFG